MASFPFDNDGVVVVKDGEWDVGSNGMMFVNNAVTQDSIDITSQLPYATKTYVDNAIGAAIGGA